MIDSSPEGKFDFLSIIVSLQSGKGVALGFVSTKAALGLVLPTLPAIIAATPAGAWLYKDRD